MKAVIILFLFYPIISINNKSEGEFVIEEKESKNQNFPILQPLSQSQRTQQNKQVAVSQNPKPQLKTLQEVPKMEELKPVESIQNIRVQKNTNQQISRNDDQRGGRRGRDGMNSAPGRAAQDGGRGGDGGSVRRGNNRLNSMPGRNGRDGGRGGDGGSVRRRVKEQLTPLTNEVEVMIPEQAKKRQPMGDSSINRRNVNLNKGGQLNRPQQQMKRSPPKLVPLTNENISAGDPKMPKFISFGMNQGMDLQYQNLLAKILNFGMLSMFTDLTDQGTTISLMLVLKQDKQIAGKDIFKVIFKVDNPKYVTGTIFYGAEFAVNAGLLNPNPNQIDFISFGKSVILENVLKLLGIDRQMAERPASLAHVNSAKNSEGLNFNGQSKSAMVEFIQTILSLTQSELADSGDKKAVSVDNCESEKGGEKGGEALIGNGVGDSESEFMITGDRI